jgi:hypothetical protein
MVLRGRCIDQGPSGRSVGTLVPPARDAVEGFATRESDGYRA